MGWQDYTVWAIGAVVAAVLLWRLICLFRGRGKGGCASCGSVACPIKGLKHKK